VERSGALESRAPLAQESAMRSSFPADRHDDLVNYLPQVLRIRPIAAILLPPGHIVEAERGLYPIRMTMALVALILFAVHTVLFGLLAQTTFALIAAGGFALLACTALLMRRGSQKLAMAIGFLLICPYVVALHVWFGPKVGALIFAFPVALGGYLAYSQKEQLGRLGPATFAIACWAVVAGHFEIAPRVVLGELSQHLLFAFHTGGALYAVLVLASHATVFRDAAERRIATERDRADGLLLNILPHSIALRLMQKPETIADSFDEVAVLFADLVGFTALSSRLRSAELVELLNRLFSEFDKLAERHGLEKIKTIGDAYMVVSGVPEPVPDSSERAAKMAIDMQHAVEQFAKQTGYDLALRIGVHVGPVTAGVIGKNKFSYDLWGDTVNVASRMESNGAPGRIHVSRAFRDRLAARFAFEDQRELAIKGKGTMETWFLRAPT
jgi:class 3 adenylate cyclase